MEGRQDRPAVAVLDRDRLHVGATRPRRPSATPYAAIPATNTGNAGARTSTGTATAMSSEARHAARGALSVERAARSASTEPTPASTHHHQQDQRQRDLAEVPAVAHVGQPGGERDEHQALGEEGRAVRAGARCAGSPSRQIVAANRARDVPDSRSCPQTPSFSSELWLVRHGETEWSRDGRHTSTTDLPLTEHGVEVAHALAPRLADTEFEQVLTSPRQRARITADLVGLRRRRGRRGPGRVGVRRLRGHLHRGDPRDGARLDRLVAPDPGRRDGRAGHRAPRPRGRAAREPATDARSSSATATPCAP